MRLGYGLPLAGGRLVGTPEAGFGLSNGTREYSLGWRLGEARRTGLALEADLSGTRTQRLAGERGPEHEAELGIGWRLQGARDRGVGFDLRIEGTRRDIANDDRGAEHRVRLSMRARWYLAAIMDAWSRRIVGYALGRRIDARLTLAALTTAIEGRNPPAGCIHHSDSEYAGAGSLGMT